MSIVRNFNLYLNAGNGSAPYINANQYDQGEQWVFTLYKEDGTKYTPSTGAIVGIKADNRGIINTGTVDADGRVVINETQQMTAAAGIAIFELLIDGDSHGTANFLVNVEQRPGDNADLSDSDLSLIQEAIDSAEVIVEVIGDGDPSEVIGEHVDAWLDNHPEATTTVEDGAITAPKINQSLWDKLLVSEEASGNPASFDDGADDVPVSSLKVALEPIQTGTGDPSPSNVRPIIAANGKNMFDPSTLLSGYYADKDTNTLSGSTTNYRTAELALYQGTYTISFSNTVNIVRYREKGIVSNSNVATGVKSYTFTVSTNATVALGFRMPDVAWDDTTTIQIERGSSVSSFQPYQGIAVDIKGRNLYPIAIGRDVWGDNASGTHSTDSDILTVTVTTASSSGVYDSGTSQFASLTPTLTGTYSYSLSAKASANGDYIVGFYGAGRETKAVTTQWQKFTFTGTFDGTRKPFNIYGTGTAGTIEIKDFMIETGSEAHDYEPYTSTSYPYTLGQSVYGGAVDLATGVLTVTHGVADENSFTALATGTSGGGLHWAEYTTPDIATNGYALSNMVDRKDGGTGWASTTPCFAITNLSRLRVYCAESTLADFKSAYSGLQIIYPLATPQTIQLTPQEVKTLLGYNNISSSGTVDVIYHADTKLYVDKMTAVDNNIIAPTEADFVATRNYTVNDLVIVADTLYKVTANIASGSAITPNSNVQQTTLGALIKALS